MTFTFPQTGVSDCEKARRGACSRPVTRPPGPRFVAYYRVSTDKQGRSGLGLDAQREAVARHAAAAGGAVAAAFEEVESGRRGDRPQLALALAECRLRRCVLLIAKLDRLARDAHFLLGLEKKGSPIRASLRRVGDLIRTAEGSSSDKR